MAALGNVRIPAAVRAVQDFHDHLTDENIAHMGHDDIAAGRFQLETFSEELAQLDKNLKFDLDVTGSSWSNLNLDSKRLYDRDERLRKSEAPMSTWKKTAIYAGGIITTGAIVYTWPYHVLALGLAIVTPYVVWKSGICTPKEKRELEPGASSTEEPGAPVRPSAPPLSIELGGLREPGAPVAQPRPSAPPLPMYPDLLGNRRR